MQQKLGARYYIFHGQRNNNQTKDAIWTAKVMDNLCKIAYEYDVKIAWENVSWCMGSDPKFIKAVKENMKEEIYFTLDVKQAIRSNRSIDEYLNVFEGRVVNVHISDSDEFCDCLLPGYGLYDFKDVIYKTKNLNKDCQYIIEVYRDNYRDFEEIKKSFEYLSNLEV
ncbi:sugar phosphate isomerase/epimerase [Caloramator sp. mosi_1]|uniref:sugar phosphate isomerase/epimerase family protein n=1 Tax=Caloramator sp. mosi_1 TaxID=3023090 RepID=UPI002361C159|nr:sugar phosphate isomerase/epimerase [Caloramator sp. mosi_1]WDC84485.1 sugar phosphate isomerase/epimerase [Caloramator sp. mosi_1]